MPLYEPPTAAAGQAAAGEVCAAEGVTADLNGGGAQILYTVPAGKRFITTRVIFRDPAQMWNGGEITPYRIVDETSGATVAIVNGGVVSGVHPFQLLAGVPPAQTRVTAAGDSILLTYDMDFGDTQTCKVDVFGLLLDA